MTMSIASPISAQDAAWPMRSHDARRTGRSQFSGPRTANGGWEYRAENGHSINMEPTLGSCGVFFGTWGLIRRLGVQKSQWDKLDGKFYGLSTASGALLWQPLNPCITPYAYKYERRASTQQDRGAGAGMHLNYFNGTIEGTAAYNPHTGTLYFGRGDGKLYAVDEATGKMIWSFSTFDPARPADPEGGGEVVGGPLLTPDNRIVFATFAAPAVPNPPKEIRHETNAVYCVNLNGQPLWRYPATGTLPNPYIAPPALSAKGDRVYVANELIDVREPCELAALDLSTGNPIWRMPLKDNGIQDLAVGIDGTIFSAGMLKRGFKVEPSAMAIADHGAKADVLWGPLIDSDKLKKSQFAGGIAVLESGNKVDTVVVSTTNIRSPFDIQPSGTLFRLDPRTGQVVAMWNPDMATPACSGGLTDVSLDRDGIIYVGARGRFSVPGRKKIDGRMYALRYADGEFHVLWSKSVDGHLDWASPAIGPRAIYFGSTSDLPHLRQIFPYTPGTKIPRSTPAFYAVIDSN